MDIDLLLNLRRLKEVGRCNNFFTLKKEDDVQHSYYVAVYSHLIAEDYNKYKSTKNNKKFNIEVLLKKALYHDIEETFIGDIPHNIKHSDPQTNELIDKAINKKIDELFQKNKALKDLNKTAKDGFEGLLVDLVDMLELAFYSLEEIVKGNNSMVPLYEKAIKIIKSKVIYEDLILNSPLFAQIMETLIQPIEKVKKDFVEHLNID